MKNFHNKSINQLFLDIGTREDGLSEKEVVEREHTRRWGEFEGKRQGVVHRFFEQFFDFMIIILLIASLISIVIGIVKSESFADSTRYCRCVHIHRKRRCGIPYRRRYRGKDKASRKGQGLFRHRYTLHGIRRLICNGEGDTRYPYASKLHHRIGGKEKSRYPCVICRRRSASEIQNL